MQDIFIKLCYYFSRLVNFLFVEFISDNEDLFAFNKAAVHEVEENFRFLRVMKIILSGVIYEDIGLSQNNIDGHSKAP